ncbi:MAG: MFS transporter [Gemmatimonadetes bacterium]|nr:MFS transporter [Gemmatimonadota bacterium]
MSQQVRSGDALPEPPSTGQTPPVARPVAPTSALEPNVKALGAVSLLADVSSEMIYPLLPLFVTTVLGGSASMLGAIEGLAETTASLLKLASGWWSDRVRRKPLVMFGYGVSSLARPLMGFAAAPWHVLVVRMSDRVGKGLRSSPRDALLAASVSPDSRGRAFGFHRAADNLGAFVGPMVAWFLLQGAGMPLRSVFLWAAVPGVLSLMVLAWFVREPARAAEPVRSASMHAKASDTPNGPSLSPAFWRYLAVLGVFTLGCSSDAFLLMRAGQLGVATALIPVLWAMHNLLKSAASTPAGSLSDRIGRKPVIVAGWLVYAAVYLLFAQATQAWHAWALFGAYALYLGLVEGVEKALVADLVPAERRGRAFGLFNFTVGIAALPASVVFGVVWERWGAQVAFGMGAALAGAAAVALMLLVPAPTRN